MVLLIAAGLLTRAVAYGLTADPGFDIHDVQAFSFRIEGASQERRRAFDRALGNALDRSVVAPHAFSEFRAITGAYRNGLARRMAGDLEISREVIVRPVSAAYFKTLGIPLVAGRAPNDDGGKSEVVINQSAARALWQQEDPLGQRLRLGRSDSVLDYVVVGVSADVPVMTPSVCRCRALHTG